MSVPPNSASTRLRVTIDPSAMGQWLEAWALRREKNLLRIDLRAAREARAFARRCGHLHTSRSVSETAEWRDTWHQLRLEIAAFLQDHYQTPG